LPDVLQNEGGSIKLTEKEFEVNLHKLQNNVKLSAQLT